MKQTVVYNSDVQLDAVLPKDINIMKHICINL